MARPGRSSQAFPELDGQTLQHRRVVRLKFAPPLDWRSALTYPSPLAIPGLELVSGDAYARTLAFRCSKVLLRAAWAGNDAIFVELASDASIEPVRVTPTLRRRA